MTKPFPSMLTIDSNSPISETEDWPNCDVKLLGFEWNQQECSVQLKLLVPNLADIVELSCDWLAWIKIDIDTKKIDLNNSAPPFTWETVYLKTPQNRWVIDFNFASDGQLKLECASMKLRVLRDNHT